MRSIKQVALLAASVVAIGLSTSANAGAILIVNGSSGTSEPSTTTSITTQLSNLHVAAGNTVTVVSALPVNLSSYAQVWDIRFDNTFALTAPTISQYVTYLAGGGGMFVMGENSGFGTRNSSILSLIQQAGGGTLAFTTPGDNQVVESPFTGPNAVTNISYLSAGGVSTSGTGQWISHNAIGGSGVAFGKGTLANATNGALTTIFDVNFMQTDANAGSQALTRNLIGFVGQQVDPNPGAVPEPATWAMMIGGFGAIGVAMRNRRRKVTVSFA